MSALTLLQALLDDYDGDLEFGMGSGSMWAGQLRLTLTNPEDAPSRSITFYSTGGLNPNDVAKELLLDARAWLLESGVVPMPVLDWK